MVQPRRGPSAAEGRRRGAVLLLAVLLAAELGPFPPAAGSGGPAHPLLYVSASELPGLRARASDTTPFAGTSPAGLADRILAAANATLGEASFVTVGVTVPLPPPQPAIDPSFDTWTFIARGLQTRLEWLTTAYLLTDDAAYARRAADIALAVANWTTWHNGWLTGNASLDTAHLTLGVAYAYDALFGYLAPEERAALAQALYDRGLVPSYNETLATASAPYRAIFDEGPNLLALILGGYAASIVALAPDRGDLGGHMAHAAARIRAFLNATLLPDGVGLEGHLYAAYALDNLLPAAWALERLAGEDLLGHDGLRRAVDWVAASLAPDGRSFPPIGDAPPEADYTPALAVLARRLPSPLAQWVLTRAGLSVVRNVQESTSQAFLLVDPALPAAPPAWQPPSRLFGAAGWSLLRPGFGPDDALLAFRAGPDKAHSHADQGSFVLNHRGHWLLTDPGYGVRDGGAAQAFTLGTVGHNALLVDGEGQAGEPGAYAAARTEDLLAGPGFAYARGDLAGAYAGRMAADRHVARVDGTGGGYALVLDDAHTVGASSVDWLLHPSPAADAALATRTLRVEEGDARAVVDVLSPGGDAAWATFPGAEAYGSYVQLRQAGPHVRVAALLTAEGAGPGEANPSVKGAYVEDPVAGWFGARVTVGPDREDLVLAAPRAFAFRGAWNPGWRYRAAVDAPASPSPYAVAELSGLGSLARPDGADLRVTDAVDRELPSQLLAHDPAGATRVLFPTQGAGRYYVYFGNPHALPPEYPSALRVMAPDAVLDNGVLRLVPGADVPFAMQLRQSGAWRELGLHPGAQLLVTSPSGTAAWSYHHPANLTVLRAGPLLAEVRAESSDGPFRFVSTYQLLAGDDHLRVANEVRGVAGVALSSANLPYLAWGTAGDVQLGATGTEGYRYGTLEDAAEHPYPESVAFADSRAFGARNAGTGLAAVLLPDADGAMPRHDTRFYANATELAGGRKGILVDGPYAPGAGPVVPSADIAYATVVRALASARDAAELARANADGQLTPTAAAGPIEERGPGAGSALGADSDGRAVLVSTAAGRAVGFALVAGTTLSSGGVLLFAGPEATSAAFREVAPDAIDGLVDAAAGGSVQVAAPKALRVLVGGMPVPFARLGDLVQLGVPAGPTPVRIDLDLVPPVSAASLAGTPGDGGWFTSPVGVSLRATDAGTGVAAIAYRLDGGAQRTYDGPFKVLGDGEHSVVFWSRDLVGNQEEPRTMRFSVDTSPPALAIALDGLPGRAGWWRSNVNASLACADAASGVAPEGLQVAAGGGAPARYQGPFVLDAEGSTWLSATCRDVAGNTASASRAVRIDATAPAGDAAAPRLAVGPFDARWLASDSTSGLARVEVQERRLLGLLGNGFATACDIPLAGPSSAEGLCPRQGPPGQSCYRVLVQDVAGNTYASPAADLGEPASLPEQLANRCTVELASTLGAVGSAAGSAQARA
jgi:hypothetical protein